MKLIDIHMKQQRRKPAKVVGFLSAQDVRYSIFDEGEGLASELRDLIASFSEAYHALMGAPCEKLDTIEW